MCMHCVVIYLQLFELRVALCVAAGYDAFGVWYGSMYNLVGSEARR